VLVVFLSTNCGSNGRYNCDVCFRIVPEGEDSCLPKTACSTYNSDTDDMLSADEDCDKEM